MTENQGTQGAERLLKNAIATFREGKLLPVTMSQAASGTLYRSMVQNVIQARLNEEQYRNYLTIRNASRAGVELAKKGRMQESRQIFTQVYKDAERQNTDEETVLLGRSWLVQGRAYLETRCGAWPEALEQISSGLEIDTRLEEQFGYTIMHAQRVHLLHLLVRIRGESGAANEAVTLGEAASEYAAGRMSTVPVGRSWSPEQISRVPGTLRNAMRMRLAGEVAAIIARRPRMEAATLFRQFPTWRTCANDPNVFEIYEWGRTKEAFCEGDVACFLETAAPFLKAGRRESTLWYATLTDLTDLFVNAANSTLALEIAADVEIWRSLSTEIFPPRWARLLIQDIPSFGSDIKDKPTTDSARSRISDEFACGGGLA